MLSHLGLLGSSVAVAVAVILLQEQAVLPAPLAASRLLAQAAAQGVQRQLGLRAGQGRRS